MAANRKTEVTKLLTVTLDKIHESKRARFGPNLRKSLLVQSVLHRAKDVYVAEVKNRSRTADSMSNTNVDSTGSSTENAAQSNVTPAKVKRRFVSQSSVVDKDCDRQLNADDHDDSEMEEQSSYGLKPTLPFSRFSSRPTSNTTVDNILDDLATESENESIKSNVDKENNPPSSTQVLLPASCGRCLKRRASVQSDNESEKNIESFNSQSSTVGLYVPRKRARVECSDVKDSIADSSKTIIMDTTPINNLVKIFSQSFLELTPTDISEHNYENSTELNTFALCRDSITLTA